MTSTDQELIRSAWAAFGRGDVDDAVRYLHPDVRWHGADNHDGETACTSRSDAAAFIRDAIADGVSAELLEVHEAGERYVAVVQTHNPPDWEQELGPHGELVTIRDGLVAEMLVYPTVEDAFAAAGVGRP